MTRIRCAVLSLALTCIAIVPVAAQLPLGPTTPRFAEIARLAQDGYADSARGLIARIVATTSRTDAAFPEALYTAGSVARTGDSMRAIYSRIVVDFSASPWAEKSLLRLIMFDYGLGKTDLVLRNTTSVFADYPDSPVIPSAALWGARAAFSQQKMQLGCDWLTKGVATVGDDLELKSQLQFAKQTCNLGPGVQYAPLNPDSLRSGPPPKDTGRPPVIPPPPPPGITKSTAKPPPPPATSSASPWRVQVAAVRDKAVIRRLTQKLETAGFKVYTVAVPGGLTRVQAGPFTTRAAALAAVPKIKTVAGGTPIVVAAP